MAIVTGNYVTSSGSPLPAGAVPQIEAIPTAPSVTVNGQLLSAAPQVVTPAADGSFALDLLPTSGNFRYLLRGSYLVADGYGSGGFSEHDVFEFQLAVPSRGGPIGELTARQVGNDEVFVLPGETPDYSEYTGFQLAANGDLFQWQE